MPWKPGESGNPNGRPTESISARKARKLLERGSPKMVAKLEKAINDAAEAGDFNAVIKGVVAWLKKTVPDAVPGAMAADKAEDMPSATDVAAAVERLRLLREHDSKH